MNNLSLFTGSGIGDLAALRAGITTVAQCENDPVCQFALRKLWPECHLFEDVHDVTAESLQRHGCLPIDIISGGFPCQDISSAGKGAGITGERSGLWFQMLRVIDEVRPAWALAENVPTLRVRGADIVLDGLEGLGYTCWPVVVGADDVGAPHKRKRVWIVGRLENPQSARVERASRHSNGSQAEAPGGWRHQDGEPTLSESASRTGCLADDDGRGFGAPRTGSKEGVATGLPGDGSTESDLANADQERREGPKQQRESCGSEREAHATVEAHGIGTRWPSRPGQPQHDWEAPRLIESGVGLATHGLARELLHRLGISDDRIPSARALRRVVESVEGKARKSALRALGNGWVPQIPEMIYRWIVEVDGNYTSEEVQ